MRTKHVITTTAFACTLLAGSVQAERPNIVLILADDMGYGDVSALNPGSQIPTPNLDRLCRQGVAFTDAHSGSALSTPTRYGILTGRYCFRTELKSGVLNGFSPPLIEPGTETIAEMLKANGYNTAIVGKWHVGLGWRKIDPSKSLTKGKGLMQTDANVDYAAPLSDGPHTRGFDYSYILPASLDMSPYVYVENGRVTDPNTVPEPGRSSLDATGPDRRAFWRAGTASASFDIHRVLDHFTDKAVGYIESVPAGEPFFLYYPMTAPHTPWLPGEGYAGRSNAGKYGDFVCHLDEVVGRVMEALDARGMAGNTILVFTSDNGAFWDDIERTNHPAHVPGYIYRGIKADVWDGGHHIPLIVRWPDGAAKPGTRSTQLVCLTDLMATAAQVNGSPTPVSAEDSRSFLGVLQGRKRYEGMRTSLIHHSGEGMFALRRGDWKFIDGQGSGGRSRDPQDVPDAPGQLYNMKRDPDESRNLYLARPKVVESLRNELETLKISGK